MHCTIRLNRHTGESALAVLTRRFAAQGGDVDYATFYSRFGGSARTKNISSAKRWLVPRGHRQRNLRAWSLPHQSGLPKEFIRLCPWEMEYLYAVARGTKLGIIETGRAHGGSCFLMACAARQTPIYSIDIAPKNDDFLRQAFLKHGFGQNVELIVGDSQNAKYPQIGPIDLLFVDGDHSYQGCWNDLMNWYDILAVNGHLVLHDCHPGKGACRMLLPDFLTNIRNCKSLNRRLSALPIGIIRPDRSRISSSGRTILARYTDALSSQDFVEAAMATAGDPFCRYYKTVS